MKELITRLRMIAGQIPETGGSDIERDSALAADALEAMSGDAERYQVARRYARMIGTSLRVCSFRVDVPMKPNDYGFCDPGFYASDPAGFDAAIDSARKGER